MDRSSFYILFPREKHYDSELAKSKDEELSSSQKWLPKVTYHIFFLKFSQVWASVMFWLTLECWTRVGSQQVWKKEVTKLFPHSHVGLTPIPGQPPLSYNQFKISPICFSQNFTFMFLQAWFRGKETAIMLVRHPGRNRNWLVCISKNRNHNKCFLHYFKT